MNILGWDPQPPTLGGGNSKLFFIFTPENLVEDEGTHSHFLTDDGRALLFWSRLVGKKL